MSSSQCLLPWKQSNSLMSTKSLFLHLHIYFFIYSLFSTALHLIHELCFDVKSTFILSYAEKHFAGTAF